ncbi:AbrB/MazE/SpoVT family DNA-binding domain-containing protein [Aurantimonas sp. Leaf443]|uniref:AbrB/MazE/SpoVT family DNA-binding domain-containing protein n=1 Tax=Aurantimonas sp. Leaf443 TaxID=1736378 RepID=UPI0012E360D8|nr:AbrB/MazE/SpoVT family DNA-binding domain-containing protein [Aurantimonas sp. Leaf443]
MNVMIRISAGGSVEIPRTVREACGWEAGTELELVTHGTEVVLRAAPQTRQERFPPVTMEEFLARRPRYTGPPVSDAEMNEAILDEARRRWDEKMGG